MDEATAELILTYEDIVVAYSRVPDATIACNECGKEMTIRVRGSRCKGCGRWWVLELRAVSNSRLKKDGE